MGTSNSDIDQCSASLSASTTLLPAASVCRPDRNLAERKRSSTSLFNVLRPQKNGGQNANTASMGSISSLSSTYLQSILGTALQATGLTNTTGNAQRPASLGSTVLQPDNSQLSPFADIMSTLQQLQQTNPSEYQQITQQISANLLTAAQTAQTDGNTTAATQLNQFSTDFSGASKSGQLPSVQDLAQAIGGGHHHHRFHASSSDSSSDNSSNTNQTLSQFLSAAQPSATQNEALNPMAIILNTLSAAGISGP